MEGFNDVQLVFFFEVVQIRFVLEDIDVQFAFGQSKVGTHIVGEFDQFDFIAFFLQSWLDLVFYHIAEVAGSCTEDDFFFLCTVVGRRSGRSRRAVFLTTAGSQYDGERSG